MDHCSHVKDKCEAELQENHFFFHKANISERRDWATIWVTELLKSEASIYFPNLCFSVKLKKDACPFKLKNKNIFVCTFLASHRRYETLVIFMELQEKQMSK